MLARILKVDLTEEFDSFKMDEGIYTLLRDHFSHLGVRLSLFVSSVKLDLRYRRLEIEDIPYG